MHGLSWLNLGLFLYEGGLLAIYKFNIYNEYLTWIGSKPNGKDISMSNTNELYDKRSIKNSEVSFG